MSQCSLDQGGGCFFSGSSLGASPGGLNYYSLMLQSVLLTAMADVTIDFLTDVTYDTVKRLKLHIVIAPIGILLCDNIHDTTRTTTDFRRVNSTTVMDTYPKEVFRGNVFACLLIWTYPRPGGELYLVTLFRASGDQKHTQTI
jgi:hypothetical protein